MNPNMISLEDARSLLMKLLDERIPVIAFFVTSTGDKVALSGKVDSVSQLGGLIVSVARPPTVVTGYLTVPIQNRACECSYGDVRLLPAVQFLAVRRVYGLTNRICEESDSLSNAVCRGGVAVDSARKVIPVALPRVDPKPFGAFLVLVDENRVGNLVGEFFMPCAGTDVAER